MARITRSCGVLVVAMMAASACRGGAPRAGRAHDSTIGADRGATARGDAARWARVGRACWPSAPAPSLSAARRDSLPIPNERSPDDDDRWVRVARTVPGGFGGYFVRDGGTEVIYLREPEKRSDAIAALNVHHIMGTMIGPDAIAERGRWDYVQLYEWYRYLTSRVHERGITSTDLDEMRNRIHIGVEDETSRGRLEAQFAALGVPCFLVEIEIEQRARAL